MILWFCKKTTIVPSPPPKKKQIIPRDDPLLWKVLLEAKLLRQFLQTVIKLGCFTNDNKNFNYEYDNISSG